MKIILLSAGKGTRMMPLTKNTPKCLLPVSDGISVLEHQLEVIQKTKVKDVVLVIGYLAEQIETKIKPFEKDLNIHIVYNPFYDVSNNLVSLWMARHHMDNDFMIINGDNIFGVDTLNKILESSKDTTMVVTKKGEYDEDDMKVIIEDNKVLQIGKDIEKANGESVGIIKFQNGANQRIKKTLDNMMRSKESFNIFYLAAIQKMINDRHEINFVNIEPHAWAEIDFHPDLKLVQEKLGKFRPDL
ncbi:MAG: phosphocholine cytidylyltransferase family protein [Nanoarchaeota archaeon]|nr:phosphocholine cytidylyltransferase family protein [Nanoarchaeota archaeon]